MADPGSTLIPSPPAADAIAAEAVRVEPKVGASDGSGAAGGIGVSLSDQFSSIVELTKPRITKLVVITSGVGFALAAIGANNAQLHGGAGGWRTQDLVISGLGCLAGTALSSAGAGSLNMWWERRRDARMPRTAKRPLPTGRLSPAAAFTVGMLLSVLGVLLLSILCGPAPALVSVATIILYILVYTPLKTMTTLNTIVGAVPGALPPLIGWTAGAVGGLWTPMLGGGGIASSTEASLAPLADPGGWSLVVLMTVWQIPHFLALAWMYRDDYARGGYRMLPLEDADGRATMTTIIVWALTLVPATLAPALTMTDRLGVLYVSVAAVSGIAFVLRCMVLVKARTRDNARRVFLASIMHLPLILLVMVADALLHAWGVLGGGGGSAS